MTYEYDPNKSASNREKHGIDFDEAQALWNDANALQIKVNRPGENRYIVIGRIETKYWTAVITYRGTNIRLISVRRARKEEITLYERH